MKHQLSVNLRLTKWLLLALVAMASVLSSNAMPAPPACVPAPSGLVSWWPGEGNANDVIGANNGTLVGGASFAAGEVGQAFSCDGASSYVSIPDSPSLDAFTTSITIELWLKSNELTDNSDWEGIVTKGNSSWRLQATSGANPVYFGADGLSPNGDLYGSRNVNDGQWHHVAAVYDGTNIFLYVDGTLDVSQPATGTIAQNNSPACIGANAQAFVLSCGCIEPGYFFNGLIDEVSIYNRALTVSEIQTIYAAGGGGKCPPTPPQPTCTPAPTGLVGWWPGEGNANDVAGTNNGTLVEGVGFAPGEVGQAFSFDGVSSYVSIPDSPLLDSLTTSITIELWLKTDQLTSDWTGIVTKGNSAWQLQATPGANTVDFNVSLSAGDLSGSRSINDGQWHHVAGVYDGTNMFLYLDGTLDGSMPATGLIPQNSYPLSIGANAQGIEGSPMYFFNGLIDEVSIYNRALTASEIQAIYAAGSEGKCYAPTPPATNVPVIFAFSPISGDVGASVTISGTNFSPVAASNIVYFGAVQAQVTTASVTNLVVTVPAGATYAPITVTVNGLVAYANAPFQPTFFGDGSDLGSSSFAPRLDLATPDGPSHVVIADLDGDGKPDLVVADVYAHVISLFQNVSTGGTLTASSFAPRVDMASIGGSSDNPYGIAVADVDGDGRLDILAADRVNNQVLVYRNLSTGGTLTTDSFAAPVAFAVGADPRYVRVADLDGDGRPDIITANTAANTISILRNIDVAGTLTTSSFAPAVDLPAGTGAYDVAVGDLDGDGKPDIAVVNQDDLSVSVYRNVATPGVIDTNSFAPRVDLPAPDGSDTIVIGDVDGDGKSDLVIGSYRSQTISVYRNLAIPGLLATNSFASEVDFSTAGWTHNVALGDLTGDGKPDIALVTEMNNAMSVFQNISTPGSFTNTSLAGGVDFETGWNAWGISVGDLDGDGRPDIVFGNAYDSTVSIYQNAMPMVVESGISCLWDVDFQGGTNSAVSQEVGFAVIGQTANDYWNCYTRDDGHGGWLENGSLTNLSLADGTITSVGLMVTNGPGAWSNESSDAMYYCFIYPFSGIMTITLTNLPLGIYEILPYSEDANFELSVGRVSYGVKACHDSSPVGTPVWTEGVQYVQYTNVHVHAGQQLVLTISPGSGGYATLAGLQIAQVGAASALDHFAWDSIPSPRFVNTPFSVTIRAQDRTNGIITNFTGTVILGTTNGIAVTPSVSGNFVQGVRTGSVVISQAVSNLVLQADDGFGHFGLADPINVINLPSLGMWRFGNIALFLWPVEYSGFVLETSGSLSPATWIVVPYSPIPFGDEYFLPLNMTGTNGFYRLRFPGP